VIVIGYIVVGGLLLLCVRDALGGGALGGAAAQALAVVFAVGLIALPWLDFRDARRRAAWQSTDGTIVTSRRGYVLGGAVIRYEYQAGSTQRGKLDVDDKDADELLHRYPVGAHVTVYFDPDRPSESSLERVASASLLDPISSSTLVLVVVAAALLWLRYRRARSRTTQPSAS
jgi:hypothetical protein